MVYTKIFQRCKGNVKTLWRAFSIYIVADPTPVHIDQDAHAGEPEMFTQQIMTTHLLKCREQLHMQLL